MSAGEATTPGLVVRCSICISRGTAATTIFSVPSLLLSFGRATSVTPWAARALDRSLAAVVVAVARHLRPELTPERAVRQLRAIPGYREEVMHDHRQPGADGFGGGGNGGLREAVERLLRNWKRPSQSWRGSLMAIGV